MTDAQARHITNCIVELVQAVIRKESVAAPYADQTDQALFTEKAMLVEALTSEEEQER